MREIVVKFETSKDIDNLRTIMKNVYRSNSDHLPDIAKFYLGDKIFIPNQVEKADLHITTASGTEIIEFSKAALSFYLGTQHPFTKVAMSSEDKGNYILLVNEELVDEDQNQQVLGVSKPRSTAYIST
ncbi:hypothetical protein [Candidatus Tisiphia endosymbiont of Ditula angustiorana]|uniref:hypothetical protein n=1 Tax=Candidatus Tisiphia endosymbiont of Ditula angustiorana TaxID=3066272 RepID=UPI00312C8E9A